MPLAAFALIVAGGSGAATEQLPRVARGTALCPLPVALRLEFGSWSEPRPGSPHEFFAAVWTRGGRGAQGGHYLSVRTQRSRKLLALAILKRSGESSFRVSKSCSQD